MHFTINTLARKQQLSSQLICAHPRDNSRTFDLSVLRSIEHLELLQNANDDSAEPPTPDVA